MIKFQVKHIAHLTAEGQRPIVKRGTVYHEAKDATGAAHVALAKLASEVEKGRTVINLTLGVTVVHSQTKGPENIKIGEK